MITSEMRQKARATQREFSAAVRGGSAVRMCRLCGCTDDHACAGGCAWIAEDVDICTACLGHTLQSWAALRARDPDDDEARPAVVCLLSAADYAAGAITGITNYTAARLTWEGADEVEDPLEQLLLAALELINAGGFKLQHAALQAGIEAYRAQERRA